MQVAKVDSFLLSFALPEPVTLTYYGGTRTILKRDAMLIRVRTTGGKVGWAPGQGSEKAHRNIVEKIAPFLEGHALADPDALRVKFFQAYRDDPEARKVYSMVEIALYDLVGQERQVPISELLGGRVRERIKLYGSAGMYMPPEDYAKEAAAVKSLGYSSYKMRPGLGPEEDLRTVELMRAATGPDFGLMVDAHTWWRMGDRSYGPEVCKRMARDLAAYDIVWLEEPLPPDDHEAYTRLKASSSVPIASGEHEPSDELFFDLIENDCVDYVQADLICQGGYSTGRRLFAEIAKRGLTFAFHSWGTDLEVLAAAHIGVCWPDSVVEWLEYPIYRKPGVPVMYEFDLANEILAEPLPIERGELIVPRAPGLGMKVNERVIEKYPWIPGPWSKFQLISPPGEWAVSSDHSIQWAGAKDH
ncbi:MAG: mandelate racemase/muconate lactonizing enzyme family protein [Bryobacteraceae bacterium]|nr:mandelate racemase/muconate lactonizing enzyme family protein [Bryobacteraceae bacterium]